MWGYADWSLCAARAISRMASVSPPPIWTSPLMVSSAALNSDSVFSTNVTISCALLRRNMPSSVREIFLFPRRNNVFPSSSSSSIICRDSVGWVTCRASAAPDMLSSLATARKYRSTLSSIAHLRLLQTAARRSPACLPRIRVTRDDVLASLRKLFDMAIHTMLIRHGKGFNISICYSMPPLLYACHRRKQL